MQLFAIGAGIGLSAYGTLKEGKEAAKAGEFAQKQYEAEAAAVTLAGQIESREKRKEAVRARSAAIAQMYAQGGQITGSKLISLTDSAIEYEADARMITRNYGVEAARLRTAGAWAAYQGRVARRASRIRALANALGQGSKAYAGAGKPDTQIAARPGYTIKTGPSGGSYYKKLPKGF